MAEPQVTESMIAQAMMKVMGQANGLMNNIPAPQAAQQPAQYMPAPAQQPQQAGALPNPTGWSVPVETDMDGVTVTVYVQFPPQTFPQYQQIIATMMNMGYNVRSFQKNNGYNGGGSSWGNRGGGSWGHRGGFGRGSWGR